MFLILLIFICTFLQFSLVILNSMLSCLLYEKACLIEGDQFIYYKSRDHRVYIQISAQKPV